MLEAGFTLPEVDVRSLPGSDDIYRRVLPNGITLLVRENFASPSVVMQGSLAVGSLDDPREKLGLADLTALGLMRGTKQRSFGQIFHAIESIGARLGIASGIHTTGFRGKALAEDFGRVLELLADVLQDPVFPEAEMEVLRTQRLTTLTLRDEDTGSRAAMAFHELAYPGHPYRFPSEGYHKTVSAITLEDLRHFHANTYAPAGMILGVVGSIHADDALDLVSAAFTGWEAKRKRDMVEAGPAPQLAEVLRKDIHLLGKSQSDLILGVAGPARKNPHFLAASLGNSILGRFGLYGRIGDVVREQAGLAYYAYSSVDGGAGPGPWQVVAGVNPRGVDEAIGLILGEIKRFITQPVSDEELLENKANFIGRMPLQLESNEGVAAALVHLERHNLGLDYYRHYPDAIATLTAEDILAAAREFWHPDSVAIAVAGEQERPDS